MYTVEQFKEIERRMKLNAPVAIDVYISLSDKERLALADVIFSCQYDMAALFYDGWGFTCLSVGSYKRYGGLEKYIKTEERPHKIYTISHLLGKVENIITQNYTI